jgi:pyridoxal phosphate enzyme (YggS family)
MLIAPHNSSADSLISANLQALRTQIAAAAGAADRTVESITVVAVSKGHAIERIRAAAACGSLHFGESYVQEATSKIESLRDLPLTWHFIGRIQANKSRAVAECFHWVHGLDRLRVAERLSAQRPHYALPLQVCLQVNIAADRVKGGIEPAAAVELAGAVRQLPRLQLRGLMCILPAGLESDDNRLRFRALRQLLQQINQVTGASLDTLSMGMSADFRDAILEGATLIRVGTAIFGAREQPPKQVE